MEEQRQRARKAREALGDLGWAGVEFGKDVPDDRVCGLRPRTPSPAPSVVALVVENEQAEELMPGVEGIVVLDKTPFYAEMGGQVADHGTITRGGENGCLFTVTDVQKNKGGKYHALRQGDRGRAQAGGHRHRRHRRRTAGRPSCAPTRATHLLDKALRTVLGDHVHQAGSLVEADRLRFDFTHFCRHDRPRSWRRSSRIVNEAMLEGYDSPDRGACPSRRPRRPGAIALFGEKYGDSVRVVEMGEGYSVEFCGGTHLDNTAKVGVFHIQSEFSVASGVRRIEATTGRVSLEVMDRNQELLFQTAAALKAKPGELREKAETVMGEIKQLNQAVERFKAREAVSQAERFLFAAHEVGGLKVLTSTVPDADADRLRKMGDFLRDKDESVVAVLAAVNDGKITFLAACGKDAVAKGVKAGDIIKAVAPICGGKGGGKPDSAMGGGSDVLKLDNALATVDDFVSQKLGL